MEDLSPEGEDEPENNLSTTDLTMQDEIVDIDTRMNREPTENKERAIVSGWTQTGALDSWGRRIQKSNIRKKVGRIQRIRSSKEGIVPRSDHRTSPSVNSNPTGDPKPRIGRTWLDIYLKFLPLSPPHQIFNFPRASTEGRGKGKGQGKNTTWET